ncbi:MAG: DUF342 domain-containing protein [Agathobacter sp.]|nr:DUF342 domain-containing protein [Agathobacter sp.]
MEVSLVKRPKVRISYDEMEAYLLLPTPVVENSYNLTEILQILKDNGVKIGIDETKISTMIEDRYFDTEVLVAKGIDVVDGVDAYFDFHFDTNFNKTPTRREDGSVDYWSIHSIELVEEGQPIATYHEPVMGSNGMNVKGKMLFAKKGRPLPPLTGKGFERSSDNIHYTSLMDGKIEMQNNRILISSIYEVHGDVGLATGNIDFRGDVVIHGNVPTGAVIKSTGNVTIDGIVEGALIESNKDVIIRGGMLGAGKGMIKAKGDVHAKFFEYTTLKVEGSIYTDSVMNCEVTVNEKIYLAGKHASVVGGVINAAAGVEAFNIGNDYGVKTEVYVGVNMELKKEINYHENCIKESQDMLDKINTGLKQLDDAIRAGVIIDPKDPRKAALLRTKIVKQADIASHTQQLNKLNHIVENAKDACVNVLHTVYPGVVVGINDSIHSVIDNHDCVSFQEKDGRIMMFSLKESMVG